MSNQLDHYFHLGLDGKSEWPVAHIRVTKRALCGLNLDPAGDAQIYLDEYYKYFEALCDIRDRNYENPIYQAYVNRCLQFIRQI